MMSGQTPNSTNISRVSRSNVQATHLVVHPEYSYAAPDWRMLRDVLAGQREIKRLGRHYLPAMKGADTDDYTIYLERAVFYNMTAQTQNGMLGQVFRREPSIRHLPAKFKDAVRQFAKDGSSVTAFTKTTMGEQIGLGRFGVLVDAPATLVKGQAQSYAVGYAAENILDWTIESVDGFFQPTRVLLREFSRDDAYGLSSQNSRVVLTSAQARKQRAADEKARAAGRPVARKSLVSDGYTYTTFYRELLLEQQMDGTWVYTQYLYREDPNSPPIDSATPVIRGKTLDFIPFGFFGASSTTADVERSPLLDIANLNLSHYRTYAELEYGRLFTALPVYYAPGTDADGAAEYHIGPNMVWEVAQGSKPGIIEYTGQGLKALETALADKERQIAAIGGRLMPGSAKSVSESNNQTTLREANEQALLLNVIQACEAGMAWVIRWWLMFRDIPLVETADLRFEINQDFLSTPIGAREIRAIQMLYNDGLIPVDTLYEYLRKAEVISSDTTLDEFKKLLADKDSFLNNPDAQARQRGFSDRGQELDQARIAREVDIEEEKIAIAQQTQDREDEKLAIAEKVGSTSVSATRKLGDPEQAKPARENPKPPTAPVGRPPAAGLPGNRGGAQ